MTDHKQQSRQSRARRDSALSRPELRVPTEPRQSPAGVTSFPVKVVDDETRRMIDAALAAKAVRS
jgi:hypothetical protein